MKRIFSCVLLACFFLIFSSCALEDSGLFFPKITPMPLEGETVPPPPAQEDDEFAQTAQDCLRRVVDDWIRGLPEGENPAVLRALHIVRDTDISAQIENIDIPAKNVVSLEIFTHIPDFAGMGEKAPDIDLRAVISPSDLDLDEALQIGIYEALVADILSIMEGAYPRTQFAYCFGIFHVFGMIGEKRKRARQIVL